MVRFDDALHEFDTIAGVTEDVTDIILNLKDIVLTSDSDEPVIVRLDVRGPADVTAGDIKVPREIEILNQDLHIATLNAKGRLAVDLTVERGRGYLSADRETQTQHDRRHPGRRHLLAGPPGHLPRRAHPRRAVDRVRPPRARHRDRRLDHAREALASAGATLRSLVELVANMSDEPQGLELGEVAGAGAGSPDLELPIEDLDLSERPRNCLKRAQINTIGELLDEDRGRPAEHHQLRPEVARRGEGQARRARPVAARAEERTRPCLPPRRRSRRFGGDAAHQRLMMANLVASLFAAEAIVTTEAKAKALRPVAEKLITKAKKGGLHHRSARSSPTSVTRR